MKLLSKDEVHLNKKRDTEKLRFENNRLIKMKRKLITGYQGAKSSYDKDKVKAKEDFDKFVADLTEKKSKLLKDLKEIERHIETKRRS